MGKVHKIPSVDKHKSSEGIEDQKYVMGQVFEQKISKKVEPLLILERLFFFHNHIFEKTFNHKVAGK